MVIDRFNNEYSFLSNMYECNIMYNNNVYCCVESAFQAQKDLSRSDDFIPLSGKVSKQLGKKVYLRKDWEEVKLTIMFELLLIKFTSNTYLKEKLLSTKDSYLIEGNNWYDNYWGVHNNSTNGLNHLGKLLMKVRDILSN